jgi:polysaccharide pyruvyl transferase WcaK-like protein
VRSWRYNKQGFEEEVARFADYVQETYGFSALFIPMRPVEDTDISKRIMSLMKHPGIFLGEKYTTDQTIGVVSLSEFMLGMRLHTLIYAAKSGTPVVGLVYDTKIKVLMDSLGQRYYKPVEDFHWEQLRDYADAILRDRDQISEEIMEAGRAAREKSLENTKRCLELLDKKLF